MNKTNAITEISSESRDLDISKRSGSEVECLTQDRGAAGSSLTCAPAWCP